MILHVDMDAFYASVEERDRPELAGLPVIVGGTPEGRGVVAAANYVVRKFGVHSAMPTGKALRLCPEAIVLRPRMEHYAAVSRQIRDVFERYTSLVEPLSLDEAFLDVTGSRQLFGTAVEIAHQIRADILRETRLTASVGVAPNKFLAKIASDFDKPDGLTVVDPEGIQQFLDPLPVSRLWGVGKVACRLLQQLGVETIAQLRQLPVELLQDRFGRHGEHLLQLANGIDGRPVIPDREAKSISHETTFSVDIDDPALLRAWLLELTEQVARRLRRHGLRARTVMLKVRYWDFRTITRSHTLPAATSSTGTLWEAASGMFSLLEAKLHPVRLLGMGTSGLEQEGQVQLSLFDEPDRRKQHNLDSTSDEIRNRFGTSALRRGSQLEHGAEHRPQPRPDDS